MKQIVFSLLFLGIIWSSNAQTPTMNGKRGHAKSKEDRTEKVLVRLDSILNLNADQKVKASELLHQKRATVKEVRKKHVDANGKLSEEGKKAFRTEMKPVHQQFQADFKGILNPEQQVKYEEMKAKKKGQYKGKKRSSSREKQ
jgi:hypothetical protein